MAASILIVDDSAYMRNLFREMLNEDFRIEGEAKNGVEAVDLCRDLEPDVVLMDVVMPIRDGIDATGLIKDEQLGSTVIVCATVGQEAEIDRAIAAGAAGYITKPFHRSMVVEAIESFGSG